MDTFVPVLATLQHRARRISYNRDPLLSRTLQWTSGVFQFLVAFAFAQHFLKFYILSCYIYFLCVYCLYLYLHCVSTLCIRRTFSISQTFSILFLFPLCRLQPASAPLYCSDISFLQVGASTYTEAGYLDSRSCMIVDSH